MDRKIIRAAVAGTGFIAPVHVEALRRLGIPVTGILGSTAEKSRQAQQALGLPKAYSGYDELLADEAVDVVHITTPNLHHFEMASLALKAGKHVMCEKPLAMNTEETDQLVTLASANNRAAGVCYNVRYYPVNLEAREHIRQAKAGKIFHINGSYVQDWLFHPTDYNWRVLARHSGPLRAVADIGTHWMDLIQSITGLKIQAVMADIHTFHPSRKRPLREVQTFSSKINTTPETEAVTVDTEDYGSILLRFDSGALGSLYVSQITAGRKNCIRYEITGSQSTLAWNSEAPNDLWIGHRDTPNQILIRDPALLAEPARRYADYPGGHNEGYPDTFKQLFRSFYDTVHAGNFSTPADYPTFADGHEEVRICDAILTSVKTQTWVEL